MKGSLSTLMGVGAHLELNTAFVRAMGQVPCLNHHGALPEVTQPSGQFSSPCTAKDSFSQSSALRQGNLKEARGSQSLEAGALGIIDSPCSGLREQSDTLTKAAHGVPTDLVASVCVRVCVCSCVCVFMHV